jgi:hypothetical protein
MESRQLRGSLLQAEGPFDTSEDVLLESLACLNLIHAPGQIRIGIDDILTVSKGRIDLKRKRNRNGSVTDMEELQPSKAFLK